MRSGGGILRMRPGAPESFCCFQEQDVCGGRRRRRRRIISEEQFRAGPRCSAHMRRRVRGKPRRHQQRQRYSDDTNAPKGDIGKLILLGPSRSDLRSEEQRATDAWLWCSEDTALARNATASEKYGATDDDGTSKRILLRAN
mmetsp:Transcript_28182/g.86379  ORF Transcript_28182/g.86379 Transcript_28182/m.86379 type:complete len:142 (+) Transcript_28182:216-641(+)